MLKLRILSDLHLEFHQDGGDAFIDSLPTGGCDVLVLAGDISSGGKTLDVFERFAKRFRQIVFVAGNHEFYGSSVPFTLRRLARMELQSVKNFRWLENSSAKIDGQMFRGASLWFSEPRSHRLKQDLNDYYTIQEFEPWVYDRNEASRKWLAHVTSFSDVVVTHHLPSERSTPARFKGSPINCFFVSDMEKVIYEAKPKLWIHGHTHDSCDYVIGETRVVCNPYGYFGHETNPRFDPSFTVEI